MAQRRDAVLEQELALFELTRLQVLTGCHVHAFRQLLHFVIEPVVLVLEVPQLQIGRFLHPSPSCDEPPRRRGGRTRAAWRGSRLRSVSVMCCFLEDCRLAWPRLFSSLLG